MKFEQVAYLKLFIPRSMCRLQKDRLGQREKYSGERTFLRARTDYKESCLRPYEWDSASRFLLEIADLKFVPGWVWNWSYWQWTTAQRHHFFGGAHTTFTSVRTGFGQAVGSTWYFHQPYSSIPALCQSALPHQNLYVDHVSSSFPD